MAGASESVGFAADEVVVLLFLLVSLQDWAVPVARRADAPRAEVAAEPAHVGCDLGDDFAAHAGRGVLPHAFLPHLAHTAQGIR